MQHFLWWNREDLAPYFSLLMLRHLKPVVKECTRFSKTLNPVDLVDFVAQLDAAFTLHQPDPDKDLLISCEGLSGHLPGWPEVESYAAVPTLATFLVGYLCETFPDAQVRVIYTTREPESWLFSAWRHHLRGHRLTEDYEDFAARLRPAADLGSVIAEVRAALDPLPVLELPLETSQHDLQGPGGALINHMNVPDWVRGDLEPVGAGNTGPDEAMYQEFLALNRGALSDDEVQARKSGMAEAVALGGWKRA